MRRCWLERWPIRTATALLVVCVSIAWCREVRVWCVPFTLEKGVSLCLEVSHHTEKVVGVLGLGLVSLLDIPSLVANTSMGGTIAALGPRGTTGHDLPFMVRVVLQADVWVFHLGEIRCDFANPTFEQMARHWFDSFCTNPSAESFAHSRSNFLFCRWEKWRAFG
jgi:hypothetical protein